MRHVDFDPGELSGELKAEWDAWIVRANSATADIVRRWERQGRLAASDFSPQIWSDLKAWLLRNVFDGKCAYCETHIKQARQPGHAEHFRPKGGIRNRAADGESRRFVAVRTTDPDGNEIDHPGYFWLAYNWENLVPSCNDCNSGRGKNNQFPLDGEARLLTRLEPEALARLESGAVRSVKWRDCYYLGPRDLDAVERRLLLHPYFDKPHEHITFGVRGIEAVRQIDGRESPKGRRSVEVYELDSDHLRRARSMAQMSAYGLYSAARDLAILQHCTPQQAHEAGKEALARELGDNPQFGTAIDDFIDLYRRC